MQAAAQRGLDLAALHVPEAVDEAAERAAHVLLGDHPRDPLAGELLHQRGHLHFQRLLLLGQEIQHRRQALGVAQGQHQVARASELALELRGLALQGGELGGAPAGLRGAAGERRDLLDDRVAGELAADLREHLALELRRGEPAPAAAVEALVAVPAPAGRVDQDAGEEVGVSARVHRAPLLPVADDRLGLRLGDRRWVGVALDHPVGARPALDAAFVAALAGAAHPELVPYRVPGVREGPPFDVDQRGHGQPHAGGACSLARCSPGGAAFQVGADRRQVGVGLEAALPHRRAIARRPGLDRLQVVAVGRPAAGAVALAHVLRHAGEALLARDHAVHPADELVDVLHHHVVQRVHRRELAEDDADAALAALVAEVGREVLVVARQARRVEDQQRLPVARGAVLDVVQHRREARAVPVVGPLDRVRVLSCRRQRVLAGERDELAALRVDRHIVPILARAQVQGAAVGFFFRHGRGQG